MEEIAFTLFCAVIISLTLSIGIAIHTLKTLEKCEEFMSFTYDLLQKAKKSNYHYKPEITE